MMRLLTTLAAALLILESVSTAYGRSNARAAVVFNLSAQAKEKGIGNKSVVISAPDDCRFLKTLVSDPGKANSAPFMEDLAECADARFIGTFGDSVTVYIVYD